MSRRHKAHNLFTALTSVAYVISLSCADEFVVTQTQYGYVRGAVLRNVNNGEFTSNVISYYAVPYAKAERFAKPSREAVKPWSDLRQTNWTASQACPQTPGYFSLTHPGWNDFSEDCLHVNIFTPFDESGEGGPYPVLVYFHGGGFRSGGNVLYPGHFLASRGTVVVVANYRLNDFGFAYTATEACPGNFGLWDQTAALEFVRDNIAYFGGDPEHVTIAGQSAGAASVGHHRVSPVSQGLFDQAICFSGTEGNFWSLNGPEQSPETYIWEVAAKLNCSEDGFSDQEMIDCLRQLPWQDLIRTRFRCAEGHFCLGMAPVVDGPGGFLPEKPEDLRQTGNVNRGPLLSGITHDDGSYYTLFMAPSSFRGGGFTREEFLRYLENRLLAIWAPQLEARNDTETFDSALHAIDWHYAPWPYLNDTYNNREAFNKLITDAAFGHPWDEQIREHSPHSSATFGYVYNYRGRTTVEYIPEWMGIPHASDLSYVWGLPLLALNPAVRQDSGILTDFIPWTDEDREQSTFWQTMLTNFANTGNPSPSPVPNPSGEPITWRPFTLEDRAFLYVNNVTTDVRTLWRQKEYAFWRDYLGGYITAGYAIPISVPDQILRF